MEAKYIVRLTFNQAAELHDAYKQMRIRMCKRKKRKNKTEKNEKKKNDRERCILTILPEIFGPEISFSPSMSRLYTILSGW